MIAGRRTRAPELFKDLGPTNYALSSTGILQDGYGPMPGLGSALFTGSGSNGLITSTAMPNLGSGAFTVELCFLITSLASTQGLFSCNAMMSQGFSAQINTSGAFQCGNTIGANSPTISDGANPVSVNTYCTYAICSNPGGSQFYGLRNGVYSFSNGGGFPPGFGSGNPLRLGSSRGDVITNPLSGRIAYIRISNIMRYTTSGYSLPTSPLTSDSNTIFLFNSTTG